MNKVVLVGNLTKDPDYRTTANGTTVCTFTVAVQRRFANQQGVREADFINCVAWRQQADFVHRFFTKGRKIGLTGSIQTRTYDAQDGTKRYVTEIVCDDVEFVDSKPQGDGASQSYSAAPKAAPAPQVNDFAGQGFTQVEDDDQLPF